MFFIFRGSDSLFYDPFPSGAVDQACFSADFAEAEQHLRALKGLCETLSPEDAHRLAQTQLEECETRLAAIQRQFSGDKDAPQPESR